MENLSLENLSLPIIEYFEKLKADDFKGYDIVDKLEAYNAKSTNKKKNGD